VYEKRWVLSLLEHVFARLREEYAAADKARLFDRIKGQLTGGAPGRNYQEIAAELGMTEGAVKVAVHRLRKRFKEALMAEVAETVASPAQVDEEIGYMLQLMSR
jgi:RNA polymerase sigma-70 factor (ECF subfamily)